MSPGSAIEEKECQTQKGTENSDCVNPIELMLLDPGPQAPDAVTLQDLNG